MAETAGHLRATIGGTYEVVREVGRGGMATVYLAHDVRHERPVALKVLHTHLAAHLGTDRFLGEVRIAARLQHPYIVPLYDSGQTDGQPFYVMPFIEGESLRQRLDRDGSVPLDEAIRIAHAVASALEYAHRQRVVHRDIKPENVMLLGGAALVTDFGVAKAVDVAANLTQSGVMVGTPAYMSPEQVDGAMELDGRSDIYSLGLILYEMLTGALPFAGPNVRNAIARMLTETAPSVRTLRPELPEWLDAVLARALSRAAADRYATAGEFAEALASRIAPFVEPTSTGRSVAVLPFVNMSNDPDNEYFTDGIAEEIINALSKVRAIRVASRTASFAYKGKSGDVGEIGRMLRVETILEGSVRKAGDRLRVTAQLVNASDGFQLWSDRYDRQLEDVFAIQDEIAGSIARALRVVLTDDERRVLETPPTDSVRAYEYFLRGRQAYHQFRRTGIQYARRMYERAIELDPGYALAYAGVADCCSFLYMYWDGSRANLLEADRASRRAVELAPDHAETRASRGFALTLHRDFEDARREFETALQLDPGLYEAHYLYARACMQEGRVEEAIQRYRDAHDVRPEEYQALMLAHPPLRALGREEEALEMLHEALRATERQLELYPDDARAYYLGSGALMALGERERALDWCERALAIDAEDPSVLYNVACTYAIGGLIEVALDCLERAIANGFGHRAWIEHDADLQSLLGHPRFEALRQRL